MDFSEGCGQIAVDAHDKWNARDTSDGTAYAACVAHGHENGRDDAEEADAHRDRSQGDGVEDAALRIEIAGGHQCEDGKGSGDIHERDQSPGAKDGPRQSAARLTNLFAHGGNEFETGEGKRDLRPEVDRVPVPGRQYVGDGEVGG